MCRSTIFPRFSVRELLGQHVMACKIYGSRKTDHPCGMVKGKVWCTFCALSVHARFLVLRSSCVRVEYVHVLVVWVWVHFCASQLFVFVLILLLGLCLLCCLTSDGIGGESHVVKEVDGSNSVFTPSESLVADVRTVARGTPPRGEVGSPEVFVTHDVKRQRTSQ